MSTITANTDTTAGPVHLTLADAETLATDALVANRTGQANARSTARALVRAEADGQRGHGLSRLPSYAVQARAGKVDGFATPTVDRVAAAALRVDAALGFAYPALELAIDTLAPLAGEAGVAVAAIHRSHHFGQAGAHVERLAERGLIGLAFSNAPKGIAFWGGSTPMMGTNPIAFAAPVGDGPPLVIDLALSRAARGRIMAAHKAGEPIPEGWALDGEGRPTTDPAAALEGSMVPIGEAKGAALVLVVEILSAALTGSHFGFEASSFFDDKGGAPGIGQLLLAIDPDRLSGGGFAERMVTILGALDDEPGARRPGTRRLGSRARAQRDGVSLPAALDAEIRALTQARV